ncbi:MAG: exonuclease SbcCD subunit D [Candidatus Limivicinus sp.]|jgi:exonuclease SbcD
MKFIHLSDLHLGKRVNEYSMLEDQEYILKEILGIIDGEKPDAVFIAGDVYDKSIPSAEAVELLDNFLVALSKRDAEVFIISGNHDSPQRLAFGGRLIDMSGIHIAPVYDGDVGLLSVKDEYGEVNIYMLPFIKPAAVRAACGVEAADYTEAVKAAVERMNVNYGMRNILITHQFVTGSKISESEEISVGGADNVDAAAFDGFDYVALGHLHRAQNCGDEHIRYCGTPLKYSFSEAGDEKSLTVGELGEKGSLKIRTVPLVPLRDMKEIKGSYQELCARDFYKDTSYQRDYMHITLTDEEDIPDAVGRLRAVYPWLMKLDYDNMRTRSSNVIDGAEGCERKSPLELFEELYELQNNQPMSEEQRSFVEKLAEEIEEGER